MIAKKLLWPDTDITSIQKFIKKKQGAFDYEVQKKDCRTTIIKEYLEKLIKRGSIPRSFTLVDLLCGDAIIITLLKKYFKEATIVGVDINKFDTHEEAIETGVEIRYEYVQEYMEKRQESIDVLLMLNTYRNFKSSGLTKEEFSLIIAWIFLRCEHPIVTINNIKDARKDGFAPLIIGKGEGSSFMADLKGAL